MCGSVYVKHGVQEWDSMTAPERLLFSMSCIWRWLLLAVPASVAAWGLHVLLSRSGILDSSPLLFVGIACTIALVVVLTSVAVSINDSRRRMADPEYRARISELE
jgi:hypothetical protein